MATEISGELTNDELTVLMIAARGESMIPIGRWKKAIIDLTARGYMLAHDEANYVITAAGRGALKDDDSDDAFARALIATHNKRVTVRDASRSSIEQAARHLCNAAKESSKITGDTPEKAAREWSGEVLRLALELLNASD